MTLDEIRKSTEPYKAAGGTTQNDNETMAKASIDALKNRYRTSIGDSYARSAETLAAEKAAALREQAIAERQAEAALPEYMARNGINGGAAGSTLAGLKAGYQSGRNDIRKNYMTSLGELSASRAQSEAEAENGLDESWLNYLLSKAQSENSARLQRAYSR